jgi:nucleotide-binding universal stress UspA family protein
VLRIVVATDFSEQSREAVRYGLAFAREVGAQLYVLHIDAPFTAAAQDYLGDSPGSGETRLREWAANVLAGTELRGVHVEPVCERGDHVAESILRFVRRHRADLLVAGSHGHTGFQAFLLGSVARRLVRSAPCPILTVRNEFVDPTRKRILVPVDLSDQGPAMIGSAARLASRWGAELDILHVVPPMAFPVSLTGVRTIYDLVPDIDERARKRMLEFAAERVPPEVPFRLHVASGNPTREIVDASRKLDSWMIVMASHGLGSIDRFFLGSVTERVIRAAARPVYTLRRVGPADPAEADLSEMEFHDDYFA